MADPIDSIVSSPPATSTCPWCSAQLLDPDATTCPSCKANLAGGPEPQVPGLTALDLERLAFRRSTTPKKSRLLSWISGDSDYEDATEPVAAPGSLAPPPAEVRREMIRLEAAALIADLAAQAGVLATDDALALGEADPAAAAAAIQAQLDIAARAQATEVAVDDTPAAGLSPTGPADRPAGTEPLALGAAPAPDLGAAPAQDKPRRRFRR
jgi:hypothetical protein